MRTWIERRHGLEILLILAMGGGSCGTSGTGGGPGAGGGGATGLGGGGGTGGAAGTNGSAGSGGSQGVAGAAGASAGSGGHAGTAGDAGARGGGSGGNAGSGGGAGKSGGGGGGSSGMATGGAGGAASGKFVVYTGWPFDATEAKRRQKETAAALGLATEIDVDLGGGVKMTMVVIPAGASKLGCTEAPFTALATSDMQTKTLEDPAKTSYRCEDDEIPLRDFTLPKPIVIGRTVVTVAQYNALAPGFTGDKTPLTGGGNLPAILSYRTSQDIVRPAVQMHAPAGWVFRIATSNEWEYAARAGVVTFFGTGNAESNLAETSWYVANSSNMQHDVAQKTPNAWDVHDMIGSAWTWVWTTGNYGDSSPDDHLVASCPYFGHPLYNECRLSNRNISGSVTNKGSTALRLVADIPTP